MALAQSRPAAITGPAVPGLAVANVEAVVGNSTAFKVAQTQRPVTYKAQIDAAEARRAADHGAAAAAGREVQPREPGRPTPARRPVQASLQQQAQTIQRIQQSGQAELQKMLEPVALSEAYVQEQIGDKLNAAQSRRRWPRRA